MKRIRAILGVGEGNFPAISPSYGLRAVDSTPYDHAHDIFLTVAAELGNNAQIRVIVDGSQINRQLHPDPVGFDLATSNSTLRGLIIDGFAIGVSIPGPDDVGGVHRPRPTRDRRGRSRAT